MIHNRKEKDTAGNSLLLALDLMNEISLKLHPVYLALGSNISPRRKNLEKAIALLRCRFPKKFKTSACYTTLAYQNSDQPDYINCCVCFETSLAPGKVLDVILDLEKKCGRVRDGIKWSSREIDIDIVLFGNLVIDAPGMEIPHYDLSQRDFFIVPLLELDDTLRNPKTGNLLSRELNAIPSNLRTFPEVMKISC